jgi:hypothetical protein
MKKLNLFIVLLAAAPLAFAQSMLAMNEVPKVVFQSHLAQNYDGITDTIWSKDLNEVYTVTYEDEGNFWESQFHANGSWVRTFSTIGYEKVLPDIRDRVTFLYPNARVESSRIELNYEGKFYVVELVEGKQSTTLYFTTDSRFYK